MARPLPVPPPVTITTTPMVSAGFSPDGNQVLTAGTSGASLWKADGSEPPEVVTADPVVAANFDSSGQRIVTIRDVAFGAVGPGVAVWDAQPDDKEIEALYKTWLALPH